MSKCEECDGTGLVTIQTADSNVVDTWACPKCNVVVQSRPDPLAQLEWIVHGGYSVQMRKVGVEFRVVAGMSHRGEGPTLADAIDALARKVGQ